MITEEIYQEFKSQMNKENDVFTIEEINFLMQKNNLDILMFDLILY